MYSSIVMHSPIIRINQHPIVNVHIRIDVHVLLQGHVDIRKIWHAIRLV